MNRKMLARIATMSLMLGIATVACTPNGAHVSSASDKTPKAEQVAARQAGRAREALARNKGDDAVSAAENAVALLPADAGYRMLLGQSYLAAGRFTSAETSFHDALALNADQPKARFDLALAQVAQGRGQEAQATLRTLAGAIPATDLGLALVLAGDHAGGIQMLIDTVRGQTSSVRARQNLALAFALDGRWRESRAVAMQDTPPDRINDQIGQWAAMASPQAGPQQVAAMLGVTPSRDAGLPTRLALVMPAVAPAVLTGAPQAVAMADPAPVAVVAPPSITVPLADPTPVAPSSVTVPLADPVPVAPVMLASQAASAAVTVPLDEPAPATPLLLAAVTPATARAAPVPALLRAPHAPYHQAVAYRAPIAHGGDFVVQLGAFARSGAIATAWSQAARQAPTLASYSPTHARFQRAGTTLLRLSISGFKTRVDAQRLCGAIKARGGSCFVRETAGDAPLEWVRRDTGTQVASR